MYDYIIVCRSLTYAQKGAKALNKVGFRANIIRTPSEIAREGCGYSIILRHGNIDSAVSMLNAVGIQPKRAYEYTNNVIGEEVLL